MGSPISVWTDSRRVRETHAVLGPSGRGSSGENEGSSSGGGDGVKRRVLMTNTFNVSTVATSSLVVRFPPQTFFQHFLKFFCEDVTSGQLNNCEMTVFPLSLAWCVLHSKGICGCCEGNPLETS